MTARTVWVALSALLGGCPLVRAVGRSEQPPCAPSELASIKADPVLDLGPAVVLTVCQSGMTVARDGGGRRYTREWTERVECDLRAVVESPGSLSVSACARNR